MRTVIRFGTLGLLIPAILGAWWLRSEGATAAVAIRPNVEVTGATPEQLAMARWAIGRFEIARLEAPAVEIEFHRDLSGCGGHLGFARLGQVDVCSVLVNAMARRALLHEMGHVWLDQNVSDQARERFLEARGVRTWNASSDAWAERGYEHGAEIIAWALGERILTAQIPDNEPAQLARGFELLTGSAPPAYTQSVPSNAASTHKGVVRTRRTAPGRRQGIVSQGRDLPEALLDRPIGSDPASVVLHLQLEGR